MKRFICITDSHLGASEGAWGWQPTYPELVPKLFDELGEYLKTNPVDFVLHTGDLVDKFSKENRERAIEIVDNLPCSFKLALGNHDLVGENAIEEWHNLREYFFTSDATPSCDFEIDLGPAKLIVVTNAWKSKFDTPTFHWEPDTDQSPALTPEQFDWLEKKVSDGRPTIIAMHTQLFGIPPEHTGMEEEIHIPPGEYYKKIVEFIETHPNIKLVLSGHCHINYVHKENNCFYVTGAGYFEPPFQIKLIEITTDEIIIRTIHPIDLRKYSVKIDRTRLWSAGGFADWCVRIKL